MKLHLLLILALLTVASALTDQQCLELRNDTRYLAEDVLGCYRKVPLSAQEKSDTLDNLKKVLEFYVFKEAVRDSPTPGPFIHIRVHIDETLEDIRKSTASDSIGAWDFFQIIQDKIFTPLADAHTSIEKPACFSGAVYQPFSLSGKMGRSSNVRVFVASVEDNPLYKAVWNVDDLKQYINQEITHIDGVPAFKALYKQALRFPELSKDPSVNFNQQLLGHSFRVRPTRGEQADLHHFAVNYTFADGRSALVPWAASHLGSVAYNDCLAPTNHSIQQLLDDLGLFRLKSFKDAEAENTTQIQMFALPNHPDVVVMRVEDFMTNVTEQVEQKILAFNQSKLLIDLRDNGGGIVCEGFHLIELLTAHPPPILYDMRQSPGLSEIVEASAKNNSYDLFGPSFWDKPFTNETFEDWYTPRVLHRGGVRHPYTQLIQYPELSCIKDGLRPPAFNRPFDEIILLTNGLCGSTCAIFSSLLSLSHDHVTTAAVGGIPHQKMSFSTFPGGMVIEGEEIISFFDNYDLKDSPYRPNHFGTSASVRFAFLELYLTITDTEEPEEFNYLPADHRIYFWPGKNDTDVLYDVAALLFKEKKEKEGKRHLQMFV
ncbi:hypothetical protein PROFUN_02774 [Planoprotostelium fungivorum]|uniref:Uncharacterized protein n=1 Tax=Planoprotostelium fungivorum TaxID=1890364 RepID=A0A2P6NXP3_9EUKA|nr:hypothetical protein PROFUN_02774 [Planoprotostelium fungivorum]